MLMTSKKSSMIMALYLIILIILASQVIPHTAEAQELILQRTWGGCPVFGSPLDIAEDVAVAPNGSLYIVGRTQAFGANPATGDENAFIIKVATDGSVTWQKTWGGANQDVAFSVAVSQDGRVYVAGRTLSFGQGDGDAFILRLDPDTGNSIWQRTWGTTAVEGKISVAVAPDGNIYVAGETGTFSPAETFVLKLDTDGNLITQKHWPGGSAAGGNDKGNGIAVTLDGSVYVGGTRDTATFTPGFEAFVLKLDPMDLSIGNPGTWGMTWGGDFTEDTTGVAASNDGVAVAGLTLSFGNASFLVKFDPTGNLVLERTLPVSDIGVVKDVALDLVDSINLVSDGVTTASTFADVHLVQLNGSGGLGFHRFLDSNSADLGNPSVTTDDGNIYVAGTAETDAIMNMTMGPMTLEEPVTPVTLSTPTGTVTTLAIDTESFSTPPVLQSLSVDLVNVVGATIGPPSTCAQNNQEAFMTRITKLQSGEVSVSPGVRVTLEGGQLFGFLVDTCSASSANFNPSDGLCHYSLSSDSNTARLRGTGGDDTFEVTDGLGVDMYLILAKGGEDMITVVDGPGPDHYRINCGSGNDDFTFVGSDDLHTTGCE